MTRIGGSDFEILDDVIQTPDGGYVAVGMTSSSDGDLVRDRSNADLWVVKVNAQGTIQWQRTYGGSQSDRGWSVLLLPNGDYLIVGETESNDGTVSRNQGGYDAWIMRLNPTGELLWQRTYGGALYDIFRRVVPASDGGFIALGTTGSNDGDVSGNKGFIDNWQTNFGLDYWLVKFDDEGRLIWQQTYGGRRDEIGFSLDATPDGGYILAGQTNSWDVQVTDFKGFIDGWVVKVNAQGNLQWQKTFGGSNNDGFATVKTVSDGYIVAGYTFSQEADLPEGKGAGDAFLVKLNATGLTLWQKRFGGGQTDGFNSLILAANGGFIISGYSLSSDGDLTRNQGDNDIWLTGFRPDGTLLWQTSLGGSRYEYGNALVSRQDGKLVVAGVTRSNDGDFTGSRGFDDGLILGFHPGPAPTLSSVKSGDWHDPATWDCGRVPTADDLVILLHRVSVTGSSSATAKAILQQAGGELALASGSALLLQQ